jgi:heat shock protein HslJ
VAEGQLYVFLSEGTLVVASPTGKPALGRWRFEGGRLTMTEEGIERRVDIVASSDSELRLKIRDPGEGVELRLVPAAAETPAEKLAGTSWRLEKLGAEPIFAGALPTLDFPEAGRIAGRGPCNRCFADVEIRGDRLRIGAIGSSRMACPDSVMEQERLYFSALENAERFEIEGDLLRVHCAGAAAPLVFRSAPETTN